jgi:hypothetical protein
MRRAIVSMLLNRRKVALLALLSIIVAGLTWFCWPEPTIGPVSFQRIQIGMTQAEVEAIIGILPSYSIKVDDWLRVFSGSHSPVEVASIPEMQFHSTLLTKGKIYCSWSGDVYNISVSFGMPEDCSRTSRWHAIDLERPDTPAFLGDYADPGPESQRDLRLFGQSAVPRKSWAGLLDSIENTLHHHSSGHRRSRLLLQDSGKAIYKSNVPVSQRNRCLFWISRCGFALASCFSSSVNRIEDLLAVDRHLLGINKCQPHLVASSLDYRDGNVIADDDALVFLSGKD